MIQTLKKFRGGPDQANFGGASLETFSGEALLTKSPCNLTAEYLKLLNLPPALELLGFLGLLLPLGKDLGVLGGGQPEIQDSMNRGLARSM